MSIKAYKNFPIEKLLDQLENGEIKVLMAPDAKVKFYSITVENDGGNKEFFMTEQFKGENMDILDMLPRSRQKIISELGGRELYHSIISSSDSERTAMEEEYERHFEVGFGRLEKDIRITRPGILGGVLSLANELSKDEKFELLKILLEPDLNLVRCHNCGKLGTDDSDYFHCCDCDKYFCDDCYDDFLDENLQCKDCRSESSDDEEMESEEEDFSSDEDFSE